MRWWVWASVVGAGELLLRLVLPLEPSVARVCEGVFLLGAAVALATMLGRTPPAPGSWGRRLGGVGWIAVALGGVRSLGWGLGVDVALANLGILAVAVILTVHMVWRRR